MKQSTLQLKLLITVLILVFCYSFVGNSVAEFKRGYNEGVNTVEQEEKGMWREIFFSVPLQASKTFPDTITAANKNMVMFEASVAHISVPNAPKRPAGLRIFSSILPFAIVALLICALTFTFLVLLEIGKGDFFNSKTMRRTIIMGSCFLAIGVLDNIFNYLEVSYLKSIIQLENYDLTYHFDSDETVIGLIIIILSFVFRKGYQMNEEEKLTI